MNTITLATLKAANACNDQLQLFMYNGITIYPTRIRGIEGVRWAVQAGEKPATGDTLHATRDAAMAEVDHQSKHADAHRAQEDLQTAARLAEVAVQAERQDTDGFADAMSPMQRAKTIEALNKQVSWSRVIKTRKQHVRERVALGARVTINPEGRVLQAKDGSYWLESAVSKVALDYAEHLIQLKAAALS